MPEFNKKVEAHGRNSAKTRGIVEFNLSYQSHLTRSKFTCCESYNHELVRKYSECICYGVINLFIEINQI